MRRKWYLYFAIGLCGIGLSFVVAILSALLLRNVILSDWLILAFVVIINLGMVIGYYALFGQIDKWFERSPKERKAA